MVNKQNACAHPRHPLYFSWNVPLTLPRNLPGARDIAAREAARLGRIEQLAVLKDFDDDKGVIFKVRFRRKKSPHRAYKN